MKRTDTEEFKGWIDAIGRISSGEHVPDLEERMDAFKMYSLSQTGVQLKYV